MRVFSVSGARGPLAIWAAIMAMAASGADAADITWTGSGGSTSFFNALNWSPQTVPGQFDTAIFNSPFPLVTLSNGVENSRLRVLQFGVGTLDICCQYQLVGNPSVEVEGVVTTTGFGPLFAEDASVAPGGMVTIASGWNISKLLSIDGSVTISSNGYVSASASRIGQSAGPSSLSILGGGSFFDTDVGTRVAIHPDSVVTVVVDGGSHWDTPGQLRIAESGTASVTVSSGSIQSGPASIADQTGSDGSVTVTGQSSGWALDGGLEVGRSGTAFLTIADGGIVDCFGNGASIGDEGCVTVTGDAEWLAGDLEINGDLTISDGGSVFNFETFIDGDTGSEGDVTVTGVSATSGEPSSWYSTGLFLLGIFGSGSLEVTDGGLVLSPSAHLGLLSGSSGTVNVTGPGSAWLDLGDFHVGELGSGTLAISSGGSVSSTSAFVGGFPGSSGTAVINGPGSSWMNLLSLGVGNFGAGSLTVSNGGMAAAPQITISHSGEVKGDGLLAGNVSNSGVASPGLSAGTLTINGNYVQGFNGAIDIELGGSAHDVLSVSGNAHLAGMLNLSIISGDEPVVGRMFTIITTSAGTVMGQFDDVAGEGGYDVTYNTHSVVVTLLAPPCPTDLDGDGAVGINDFLAVLGAWGPCPTPPASCPADLDGDGAVGINDFLAVLGAWGPCP